METLLELLPSAVTVVAVILALYVVQRLLDKTGAAATGRTWRNQLIMLGLIASGILLIILVIPIGDAKRGQLLSLIGILLTAAIALSSTTILGNAMAGVMLRGVRSFRIGDFIETSDHFGRVTERGLFHTEIQTEDRRLTTLPNLYLVTHPVSKIRNSGTIVSAEVSLGYDVPRVRIEELLIVAAGRAELKDPFVRILALGDYSVTYRVAGMLEEVKQILTARSRLRAAVMDVLHEDGVEIVSPAFMNQRRLSEDREFIPARAQGAARPEMSASPEDVVFDKAEEAESIESLRKSLAQVIEEMKSTKEVVEQTPKGPDREKAQSGLSLLEARKARLEKIIATREAKAAEVD